MLRQLSGVRLMRVTVAMDAAAMLAAMFIIVLDGYSTSRLKAGFSTPDHAIRDTANAPRAHSVVTVSVWMGNSRPAKRYDAVSGDRPVAACTALSTAASMLICYTKT